MDGEAKGVGEDKEFMKIRGTKYERVLRNVTAVVALMEWIVLVYFFFWFIHGVSIRDWWVTPTCLMIIYAGCTAGFAACAVRDENITRA